MLKARLQAKEPLAREMRPSMGGWVGRLVGASLKMVSFLLVSL